MSFLILPDSPDAAGVAERAGGPGTRVIRHASGRPWLVGDWRSGVCAIVTAGGHRLAVFGRTDFDRGEAQRRLADARTGPDLDALARRLPGAVHLATSLDGLTRTQGTISTARQVFYADVNGVTVAADDPGTLVQLTGAAPDEDALALRLVSPIAPWPLLLRPIWNGVRQLAVGHWLEMDTAGRHREVEWWRPPPATEPLPTAATAVRDALVGSLGARVATDPAVSADLSGGLDSTSLCFLADHAGADLVTQHWIPVDRANDDTAWARRAAEMLPRARHRFVEPADAPTWFAAGPGDGHLDAEGPLNWTRNRNHHEHQSRLLAAEDIHLHLIGVGGDELFGLQSTYFWSLLRRHPLRALPRVRRAQLVNRWSLGSTVRGLLDRTTYARSLAVMADGLATEAPRAARQAPQRWGNDIRLPPWASAAAIDAIRRQLRDAADAGTAPLSPDRLQHQTLQSVVRSGVALRQLNSVLRAHGVDWEAPMLDDRVLEAALAVRVEDRVSPGRYKPVLTAALRGVVPEPVLARRNKGEFSAEMYAGVQRNLRALLDVTDDLRLARLGLVDADLMRAELLRPQPDLSRLRFLEATLAYENWLRAAEGTRVHPLTAGDRS
ncbi:asparagine synthase-related protein [Micromonospora sp. NBC_01796]|uniref:asparagine synthase-related protein n=1 Tax=Micromonospora sp. NBC_01796 TaxID=2975987 RepID=UPI002DDB2DBC|nr:asparagine synthase-related protein [Micromonospora sp. NBC_01796]WSA83848.1 asparagine synthase-related protein [Micromonospora sp. NBC_01796]